jgi:dihydropyrimidine dehydrogenase (NAD+) subunit PreT
MSENPYCTELPEERLEGQFPRQKPILDDVQARAEAARCLFCHDAPCTKACPASIDVGRFIWDIHTDNWRGAARAILKKNVFGLSCAMVCPVPDQCEGACVLNYAGQPPVAISLLQRYATERLYDHGEPLFDISPPSKKKVALVGAGPASLACAHELALRGHECVVFERRTMPGGLGTYAMAPYKITTEEVLDEVRWIERTGFEVRCGVSVGEDVSFDSLVDDYDALFLGVGLGADTTLAVPNRDTAPEGVIGALELIGGIKTAPAEEMRRLLDGVRDAVIIGGGSTAMDMARELAGLAIANVTVVYRRAEAQTTAPAQRTSLNKAGVVIRHLLAPLDYLTDATGRVAGLKLNRCELGEPDGSGRASVRMIDGAEELMAAQLVILAIGQEKPREIVGHFAKVAFGRDGCIVVRDEAGRTDHPKIFAGGDCVNGGRELVHAVAAGRRAALAIDELLSQGGAR